jgi:hypothetical protein
MRTHAHTHTHTHIYTHAHIYIHTHTRTHTRIGDNNGGAITCFPELKILNLDKNSISDWTQVRIASAIFPSHTLLSTFCIFAVAFLFHFPLLKRFDPQVQRFQSLPKLQRLIVNANQLKTLIFASTVCQYLSHHDTCMYAPNACTRIMHTSAVSTLYALYIGVRRAVPDAQLSVDQRQPYSALRHRR